MGTVKGRAASDDMSGPILDKVEKGYKYHGEKARNVVIMGRQLFHLFVQFAYIADGQGKANGRQKDKPVTKNERK